MSRWPPEVTGALAPEPSEVAGLRPAPPPPWCAEVTAPTEAEVARLLARAARVPAPRRVLRPALAWALVGALAVLAFIHLVPLSGQPAPVPGAQATLHGQVLHLGPSISVTGDGEIEVLRADEQATELALLEGSATFEVDPQGARRHLVVQAGGVRVEVTGTRFIVSCRGEKVGVEVLRGSVQVHRADGSLTLRGGERWSGPAWGGDPIAPIQGEEPVPPKAPEPAAPSPAARAVNPGHSAAPPAANAEAEGVATSPTPEVEPPSEAEENPAAAAEAWAALLALRADGASTHTLLADLERFLAEHSDPLLGAEASALRLGLLAEQLPGEKLMPQIDAWLGAHPRHARGLEVELLRATVAREELGDCALALPSYERVAREAAGDMQAVAQAWAERCRAQEP
ncbi:MAG: FecR domain-containing protein [Pseudomonadota bacterium]